jgi:hypothetical protein
LKYYVETACEGSSPGLLSGGKTSALTERGKRITLDALEFGAVDFVTKPKSNVANGLQVMMKHLIAKVKIASTANVSHWKNKTTRPATSAWQARPMAYVIHLADTLAMMQGFDTGLDSLQYSFDPDYVNFVKLESQGLEGLALDVQVDFKGTAEALFGDEQENEE